MATEMKKNNKIKVVSLFCGCGGTDLGLVGGFSYLDKWYPATRKIKIIHASDIDSKVVETYNLNFKHKARVVDVSNLSFPEGYADIVIGGFPCQAFSTVNPTKKPHHRENQLFWQMSRIIGEIRPRVFIAENVKGFYRLGGGKYFKLAKRSFEDKDYTVHDSLLNSSDFGVPQLRERLFLIGIHNSFDLSFEFPKPTHGPDSIKKLPKTCLRDAIENLFPADPKYYFSKKAVEGVKKAKPNMKRALAQNLNGQCLTITSHLAKVSLNSRDPVLLVDAERELYRRFTPREASRIQSFPDSFRFNGSERDAYRQIGNAVPPVVMWHLGRAILKQIF